MTVVTSPAAMNRLARTWERRGETVGLVPTMGALHEGHASLVRRALRENDRVVVSIFLNPLQFRPSEDYGRYPRTLSKDLRLCSSLGANAVFHPSTKEMYPPGFETAVSVLGLSKPLCGRFRPGHFQGVATVVLKLLLAAAPDKAYFGEKDYQQWIVVRRMASDLNVPVEIVPCPIVRDNDGLALSSRNAYLTPDQRRKAPGIYASLVHGAALARTGRVRKPSRLCAAVRRELEKMGAEIDYVRLVDAETLAPARRIQGVQSRLMTAVRLGKTRLIDNIAVSC